DAVRETSFFSWVGRLRRAPANLLASLQAIDAIAERYKTRVQQSDHYTRHAGSSSSASPPTSTHTRGDSVGDRRPRAVLAMPVDARTAVDHFEVVRLEHAEIGAADRVGGRRGRRHEDVPTIREEHPVRLECLRDGASGVVRERGEIVVGTEP